jgi:dTDP-4-dehydrorhamnose reductase
MEVSDMKILLLGASGFLGSVLYETIKQSGTHVIGTCFRNGREGLYPFDVTDGEALSAFVRDHRPDTVIWSLMSGADEERLIQTGLTHLLDAVSPETKIVYVSTDGLFDGRKGAYREEEPPCIHQANNQLTAYCNAKLEGEQLLRRLHPNHLIVRTGPLYGRDSYGNWDKRVAVLLAALERGEAIERTSNLYRTFVWVDDLAEALLELARSDMRGVLHVGPSAKESYYSFHRIIAERLGLNPDLIKEETLAPEEADKRGLPLDTSLDTSKARRLLSTRFCSVQEAALL